MLQITWIGNVDWNLIRENIDMELIRHRHIDDLAADQVRLRLFRPGKLVNSQVHFKALIANLAHDFFVRTRKWIEGARQKGHFRPLNDIKSLMIHAPLADEIRNRRHRRSTGKEADIAALHF